MYSTLQQLEPKFNCFSLGISFLLHLEQNASYNPDFNRLNSGFFFTFSLSDMRILKPDSTMFGGKRSIFMFRSKNRDSVHRIVFRTIELVNKSPVIYRIGPKPSSEKIDF